MATTKIYFHRRSTKPLWRNVYYFESHKQIIQTLVSWIRKSFKEKKTVTIIKCIRIFKIYPEGKQQKGHKKFYNTSHKRTLDYHYCLSVTLYICDFLPFCPKISLYKNIREILYYICYISLNVFLNLFKRISM